MATWNVIMLKIQKRPVCFNSEQRQSLAQWKQFVPFASCCWNSARSVCGAAGAQQPAEPLGASPETLPGQRQPHQGHQQHVSGRWWALEHLVHCFLKNVQVDAPSRKRWSSDRSTERIHEGWANYGHMEPIKNLKKLYSALSGDLKTYRNFFFINSSN